MTAEGIRLQKYLAQSGVASRRKCEELMQAGRVEVDGSTALAMGLRIDPATAVVRVDGKRILPPRELTYLVLNKPRGVVCSMADEQGRPDLHSVLTHYDARLFHVGRLDTDTSGLLIMTNDGELAHRLAHPSFEVAKTYVALVEGTVKPGVGDTLRSGVTLDDGAANVDRFIVKQTHGDKTLVELTVHIGRNRIVRRLMDHVGHRVIELTRTAFGPLRLGNLKPGESRSLTDDELGTLFDNVGL